MTIFTTTALDTRLRAICDLTVPTAREAVGRHEYDGVVQDLSPGGVRRALARLDGVAPYADGYDERLAAAAEDALRVRFGELELHRVHPTWHLANLDVSGYRRAYAPAVEREGAEVEHLRQWPDAVDAAITALDRVPAPVARATLPSARALAGDVPPDAARALDPLVAHLERACEHGEPSAALGATALARLLSSSEAIAVDLGRLAERAERERERMRAHLDVACRAIDPSAGTAAVVRALQAEHPGAAGLLAAARRLTDEALAWTADRGLVPHLDGECRVEPMPPSRHGPAEMVSAAPAEADAPALFHVNPPDPAWSPQEQEQWLGVYFSDAFLPAMVLHEVAPGHFAHGRALRRVAGDARRTLLSEAFIEGWAVYAEELALKEGFRGGDPRFTAGVALSALERATRMACVIGLHTGAMTEDEVARRFAEHAFFSGPAARQAVARCTYEPTWVRYTWGKLAIRDLRERARAAWGSEFSLVRFHARLLGLGAPPLGLMDAVLEEA